MSHCQPYYDFCWDAAIQGQSNNCWQSYLHTRFGLVCLTASNHYLCIHLASVTDPCCHLLLLACELMFAVDMAKVLPT